MSSAAASSSKASTPPSQGTKLKFDVRGGKTFAAFFSYSSNDKDIVHEIAEKFTNRGVRIWLDKTHIEVKLNRAMKQGILDSALVVLFISDSYIKSKYCELEYNYANDMEKVLYPVRLSRSRAVLESDPSFLTSGTLYIDLTPEILSDNTAKAESIQLFESRIRELLEKIPNLQPSTATHAPTQRKGMAIPPLADLPNPKNYIDREDLWSELGKELAKTNVAILRGVGGS
ncbi:hypothetical protein HK098_005741, partial [Nowakowskiella sp. JEL0407]